MADDVLVEQLMALQLVAKEEGLQQAWAWLGRQIAQLLEESKKPKRRRRPRGRWVRLAATGEKAMLPADLVAKALADEKDNGRR